MGILACLMSYLTFLAFYARIIHERSRKEIPMDGSLTSLFSLLLIGVVALAMMSYGFGIMTGGPARGERWFKATLRLLLLGPIRVVVRFFVHLGNGFLRGTSNRRRS